MNLHSLCISSILLYDQENFIDFAYGLDLWSFFIATKMQFLTFQESFLLLELCISFVFSESLICNNCDLYPSYLISRP